MLFKNLIIASVATLAVLQPALANNATSTASAAAAATPQAKPAKKPAPLRIRHRGYVYRRLRKVQAKLDKHIAKKNETAAAKK